MSLSKITILAAIAVLMIMAAPAEARHYRAATSNVVTCYQEHRVVPCQSSEISPRAARAAHTYRRGAYRTASLPPKTVQAHHRSSNEAMPQTTDDKVKVGRSGMVTVQTAYHFPITVHPAYAAKFQRLFSLMKDRGYVIPERLVRTYQAGFGCFARGGHVSGSNHYIGAACDIQWGWNAGPSFVYRMGDLIRQAGLYDGCAFKHPDCGHVEAVRGTHNRAPNLYAALVKFKEDQAAAKLLP